MPEPTRTPHVDHYRLVCPVTDLAIRLHETDETPPRVVPRLVSPTDATRFASRDAANTAWATHIGVAVLELQRVDA